MKRIFLIILSITIIMTPVQAQAKTVTRYATKTIKLQERCSDHAKTIAKVKVHTKLKVTKTGKTWARVEYNGQTVYTKKKYIHAKRSVNKYKGRSFKRKGRVRWNGASWTWYTQRMLPGRGLKIPGRHVDERGFVCDKDGYIVLASSIGYKKQRKILPTPFGKYGKVYDTNGTWNYGWRDCYTDWTP